MKDLELFTWWCQNLMKYILNHFKIINWDCGFESLQQTKKRRKCQTHCLWINANPRFHYNNRKLAFPLQQQKINSNYMHNMINI